MSLKLQIRNFIGGVAPKSFTKFLYKRNFKKNLDLKKPVTLNEKVLWLKFNYYKDNALITMCADKYRVREYVGKSNRQETLNSLLGVWESPDEINWNDLPEKFVLKCNHGAGYNLICESKSKLDIEATKRKLREWLNEDYWKYAAELNYKDIPKKIICEKYLETEDGLLPEDYKLYCFDGKVNCIMLCVGRENGTPKFYYFDTEWNVLPYSEDGKNLPENFNIPKPQGLEDMINIAEDLAKPFPFVRADFYLIKGKVIFGELTFTPGAGLDSGRLESTDLILGDLLKLPL